MEQASAMVVLLSPAAKASPWVENEVTLAQRKEKPIYPILVEGDEDRAVLFQLIDVQRVDGRQSLGQVVDQVVAQMGHQPAPSPMEPVHPPVDPEFAALAPCIAQAKEVLAQAQARTEEAAQRSSRPQSGRVPRPDRSTGGAGAARPRLGTDPGRRVHDGER